jgi:hypothetical protein
VDRVEAELPDVARAVARVERLEGDLAEARREVWAAAWRAHEAGVSYSALARVLKVTRQRAARIVSQGAPE